MRNRQKCLREESIESPVSVFRASNCTPPMRKRYLFPLLSPETRISSSQLLPAGLGVVWVFTNCKGFPLLCLHRDAFAGNGSVCVCFLSESLKFPLYTVWSLTQPFLQTFSVACMAQGSWGMALALESEGKKIFSNSVLKQNSFNIQTFKHSVLFQDIHLHQHWAHLIFLLLQIHLKKPSLLSLKSLARFNPKWTFLCASLHTLKTFLNSFQVASPFIFHIL